ncbi:MAG: hypothetical protein NWR45_10200 [Candidatus Nanopelagicales bacterium]|jgi:hypothetical protein|nr:hypothetical protein [Candidatus Nanopelagicales bacterium]
MSTPGSPRWRARWVFVSFLITWVITRIVTTALHVEGAGSDGGLMIGGVHIHHAIFGITILLVMTLAWVIGAGWSSMSSTSKLRPILYGIGWALILDELALVLNLADVYWAPLEDVSLIAVAIFVIVTGVASVRASDRFESV